jgi:hypothetical protein
MQGELTGRERPVASAPVSGPEEILIGEEGPASLRARIVALLGENRKLRKEAAAVATLPSLLTGAVPGVRPTADEQIKALEARLKEQTDEIARLHAEIAAALSPPNGAAERSVRESKIWLKARLERLEGDLDRERNQTGRLRAELAAVNDRSARQLASVRDDLKRLGNRTAVPARTILKPDAGEAPASEPTKVDPTPVASEIPKLPLSERAKELHRALQGRFGRREASTVAEAPMPAAKAPSATDAVGISDPHPDPAEQANSNQSSPAGEAEAAAEQKGRLLDRLKRFESA